MSTSQVNDIRSAMSHRHHDQDLGELIDALVEAADIERASEIDRVRSALEPFGGAALFSAELRLSGRPSEYEGCICCGAVV